MDAPNSPVKKIKLRKLRDGTNLLLNTQSMVVADHGKGTRLGLMARCVPLAPSEGEKATA